MRIAELLAIERTIKGARPGERRRIRSAQAAPKLAPLNVWFEAQQLVLSSDSTLARAVAMPTCSKPWRHRERPPPRSDANDCDVLQTVDPMRYRSTAAQLDKQRRVLVTAVQKVPLSKLLNYLNKSQL